MLLPTELILIDPALLRSGRLDRKIEFPAPMEEARARIMQIHARKMKVDPDMNYEELARSSDDFNGALVSDRRGAVPGQDEGLHGVWTATRSDFHLKREAGFNQNVPKRLNVVKNKRGAVTKFLIFSFQELSQGSFWLSFIIQLCCCDR